MTASRIDDGELEHLRVVVYKEGDAYVAQCLEYDIATQAPDLDVLLERLDLTIDAECSMSKDHVGKPFEGIPPAPNYFHGLWDKRSVSLAHLRFPIAAFKVEVAFAKGILDFAYPSRYISRVG